MNTEIKKIGNSKGVIIPAAIIKMLGLDEKDEMNIVVKDNKIILSKAAEFNPKSLEELFAGYNETYKDNIVFDDTKGREIW
ncbi:MAG TPA: AbrB/MazE/SpoVT family DNA-binding domain-containing protein [Acholeplasma sp.]|jgi:antitoxin MazE|nr:AbrB/MazE/SpoVT family DNA-binding domain-containing protein [Acholeplasma sp.]